MNEASAYCVDESLITVMILVFFVPVFEPAVTKVPTRPWALLDPARGRWHHSFIVVPILLNIGVILALRHLPFLLSLFETLHFTIGNRRFLHIAEKAIHRVCIG